MALDMMTYEPLGDKKSSDFFNEYRLKIFERRKASGVEDLLDSICALVVQVETGDALAYMEELYLMTPYRLKGAFVSDTHKIYFMESKPEFPRFIVLEPLNADFEDDLTRLNNLYPLARKKPNARYVGEIFTTQDLDETRKILESHNIRFHYPDETENKFFSNEHFYFSFPSSITGNRIGYTPVGTYEMESPDIGQRILLRGNEIERLEAAEAKAASRGTDSLILGVDHSTLR